MARTEIENNIRLVLNEEQLRKMYEAVKDKKDFWVRLCVESNAIETYEPRVVAYLQGPDGEEEWLYEV